MELTDIMASVNRFFTQKHLGEKCARLIICAHSQRRGVGVCELWRMFRRCWCAAGMLCVRSMEICRWACWRMQPTKATACSMKPGDRFILVTDGVTEAENARRRVLRQTSAWKRVAAKSSTLEDIFASVVQHSVAGTPLGDDCTVVEDWSTRG